MCGIAGIWYLDGSPFAHQQIDAFLKTIAHRGPDAHDVYIDKNSAGSLALGNNRLAIVDPQPRGNQPMTYGDGRLWITYNGEIYNFREIRDELRKEGFAFTTDTDTEVILAAYMKWGTECQLKFNGVWAFAIWDSKEKALFLSRDRFGVKPLYTYHDGKRFAFASEVKAFLALEWLDSELDYEYLAASLFWNQYLQSTEDTLLRSVKRLPAGHSLTVEKQGTPKLERWWNTLDHLVTTPSDFNEQAVVFRELFTDACRIRRTDNTPMAVSLSGGIDSSSVLATIHQVGWYKQPTERPSARARLTKAYVATFKDSYRDESRFAEMFAQVLGIRASYEKIDPIFTTETLDRMLYHAEDANSVHLGNWKICEAMRRDGVPVAMTGDGSDELFGAYPYHIEAAMAETMNFIPSIRRLGQIRRIRQSLRPEGFDSRILKWRYVLSKEWNSFRSALSMRKRTHDPANAEAIAGSELLTPLSPPVNYAGYRAESERLPKERILAKHRYFDFHYGILPWILHQKDMLSMAHGIEIRSPFMDWRIACFCFSLPSASLIGGGYIKRLLRESMAGRMPESIRTRTSKIAFVDSEAVLFYGMRPAVQETIQTDGFQHSPLWDGKELQREIEAAYRTGEMRRSAFFWKCVKTERLIQKFREKSVDKA